MIASTQGPPTSGPGLPLPGQNHWTVQMAVGASLATLLDGRPGSLGQFGLFAMAAVLTTGLRRLFPQAGASARAGYYLLTAPIFLLLTSWDRLSGEWMAVRIIYYLLLAGLYLLPFLSFSSAKELRRMTVLLVASFFYSATYLHSPLFFPALLVASLSLLVAFYALPMPNQEKMRPGRLWRRAAWQLCFASLCGLVVFGSFPRSWFRAPRYGHRFRLRDLATQASLKSQQLNEAGVSTRRDLLELAHLVDFSRSSTELLRLRMTYARTGLPFYPTNSLYLRGSLFDTYVNGHWTSSASSWVYSDAQDGRRDNWTWITNAGPSAKRQRVRQFIQMEPLDDICFSLPEPVAINQVRIKSDRRGVLLFPSKTLHALSYEVLSELPPAVDRAMLDEPLPAMPAAMAPYLEFPPVLGPVLKGILARLSSTRGPGSTVEQICQWLRRNYEYGGTPFALEDGIDPVTFFLTESHRGYCTHFASALALLARAEGLPSRVATGLCFGGAPSEDGNYHLRDLNAHAWTEIYFPRYGWVQFDPTPADLRPSVQNPSESVPWWQTLWRIARVHDLLDEYGVADQRAFLMTAREIVADSLHWWSRLLSARALWLGLALGGALAWVAMRGLPLRRRRRLLQRLSGQPSASSVPFYEDMLWILSRHGLPKPAALTGSEYSHWVLQRCPCQEIPLLTQRFYQVKYGAKALSAEELTTIQQQLQNLEAAVKALGRRKPNGRTERRQTAGVSGPAGDQS